MSIKTRFKLQGLSNADMTELLSNPPRLSQYLLGPITSKKSLVLSNGNLKQDRGWMRAIVNSFVPIFRMRKVTGDNWSGVSNLIENIVE